MTTSGTSIFNLEFTELAEEVFIKILGPGKYVQFTRAG